MLDNEPYRSGYVAIVGRPNMGKSTLLNHFLGQKISITSRRPQTTRHRILGIKSRDEGQLVYVDTPGLHSDGKKAMNRYLNKAAGSVIAEVDVILFMVEKTTWTDEDEKVLERLEQVKAPVILVVNKVDQVKNKDDLIPHLEALVEKRDFHAIVPMSATRQNDAERLEEQVLALLPEGMPIYPEDQITDRSMRFLAAEIVREKLTRRLNKELPYALSVEIEQFQEEKGLLTIHALIWVERDSQKAIVIGAKGANLKAVGEQARLDMQKLFDSKILLKLWVKVKEGWSDDDRALRSLGYEDI